MAGCISLFRIFGIGVYLHWTWFVVAAMLVYNRMHLGVSGFAALAGVLSLFGIVLLHEFGHALACKSVGGEARTIVLWPLGGVAFVKPPPRPGPMLWSLAAGPLVNVLLIPVTVGLLWVLSVSPLDFLHWAASIFWINLALLIFNMLPIYPLDGGQILQTLLWFAVGRALSLRIAAGIGLVVGGLGGLLALMSRNYWWVLLATFIVWHAWNGFRTARVLAMIERREKAGAWPAPSEVSGRQYVPPTPRQQ